MPTRNINSTAEQDAFVVRIIQIDIDQAPLTESLRIIKSALDRAHQSEGVPIAPIDAIVIMKLFAGRSQDLADVEAIVESGVDREILEEAVLKAAPDLEPRLGRLFHNVDARR